jgi:hypothetical protein
MDYVEVLRRQNQNRRIGEMDMLNKALRVVLNKQTSLMGDPANDKAFRIVNEIFEELFKLRPE